MNVGDLIINGTVSGLSSVINTLLGASDAAAARDAIGANDAANLDTGAIPIARLPAGCQIQATQRAETSTQVTHTTSWADVVSVAITPQRTDSEIEISANIQLIVLNSAFGAIRLLRDATVIYAPNVTDSTGDFYFGSTATTRMLIPLFATDSPNTTSGVTYKIQVRAYSSTGTVRTTEAGPTADAISHIEARETRG